MFGAGITAVLAAAHQGSHSMNASQYFPLTRRLGEGKILEGNVARTADLNYPKGYSIFDVHPDKRFKGKEHKGRATTLCVEALLPRKRLDIAC